MGRVSLKRTLAVLLVVTAVVVPGIALWRYNYLSTQPSAEAHWGPLGAAAFARIEYAPMGSRDRIAERLRGAAQAGGDLITEDQYERLLLTASSFLEVCFLEEEPDANLRWRAEHGFRMKSRHDLIDHHRAGILSLWSALRTDPFPEEATPKDWFTSLWKPIRAYGDGATQMVALAESDDGLVLVIADLRSTNDPLPDPASAPRRGEDSIYGAEHWTGGSGIVGTSWWEPAATMEDVIEASGRCTAATFGIIAEFANGERRPISLTFFWDPNRSAWILERFGTSNLMPGSKGTVVLH